MRKLFLLFTLILTSACVEGYSHNDLRMLTAYRAKEVCSCLFVQQQSEAFCEAYTVANPNLATYSVNFDDKTVQAEALMMWSNTAKYNSAQFGCVLDPIP